MGKPGARGAARATRATRRSAAAARAHQPTASDDDYAVADFHYRLQRRAMDTRFPRIPRRDAAKISPVSHPDVT